MNTASLQTIGLFLMLCSVLAAVFRQQELFVYGVFFVGFLITIIPADIWQIPFHGILTVVFPLIALHVPIPLQPNIPGLIRLGIIISVWTIALLGTICISSFISKKLVNNNPRKTSE
ncbi:MAG TPA: hypothetical protein VJI96_04630 [Candidatus Andersenbacteria bacterium]|nr:hypothetical protein [Candidatus Andersenbacteria bacterium]